MKDLKAEFEQFHKENPHVYELFRRFTYQAIDAGRRDFGAKAVIERIRWSAMVDTRGEIFKINNNYASRYARKFMEDHPEHAGLFQTRKSIFDGKVETCG